MKRNFLAVLILTVPQFLFAKDFQLSNYEENINKCYMAMDTASTIFCFNELNSKLDEQIEKKYGFLKKWIVNEKNKSDAANFLDKYEHQLSLSQRAWEVYININCEAVAIPFSEGSGVYTLINMQGCSAQEKINRLKALSNYYPR